MTLYGCCCCCWLLLVWAGVVSCCWVGMSSPTEGSHSTPSYRLISILAPPHHHSDQTGPASTTLRGSQGTPTTLAGPLNISCCCWHEGPVWCVVVCLSSVMRPPCSVPGWTLDSPAQPITIKISSDCQVTTWLEVWRRRNMQEKFRGYGNIVGHFPWWCCWRDLRCFYLSKKEETSRVFP